MKKGKLTFIFLVILTFSLSWSSQDFNYDKRNGLEKRPLFNRLKKIKVLNKDNPYRCSNTPYAPHQILVKFKPSVSRVSIKSIINAYNLKEIKRIPSINVFKFEVPKTSSLKEVLSIMNLNPDIEYAEPNYKVYITVTPNDPLFSNQYALYNKGQEVGPPGSPRGTERADIHAPEGWKETEGDDEVVIAIIDTGVDLTHSDIKEKILNSGRDFVNDDFDASDDHGHGTIVAGVAGAVTDNSLGIAGVAWNCKILPIKVLDENGEGYVDAVIEGIDWAVQQEADVINMSFGSNVNIAGLAPSRSLEDSIKEAYEQGVVLVAAAGNEGGPVLYPAAFDAYVIAVAATDYNDQRVTWSNFGPEIDVAAPGIYVLSLWPEYLTEPGYLPYVWADGTSMATPHVSGLAALIKSIKPWLKASEIMDVIRYSADDTNSALHPGKDDYIGYGRINMEKALVPTIIK